MKWCYSAGVHWCIALLEYPCTPSPDGELTSQLIGRQFRSIMPIINDYANNINVDHFADRKDKQKK